MKGYVRVTGKNLPSFLNHYTVLIGSLRQSRSRAKHLALWELFFLLKRADGILITNSPFSQVAGQMAFFVKTAFLPQLSTQLETAGYTDSFYTLDFSGSHHPSSNDFVWRGQPFTVQPFLRQNKELYQQSSPHNREFLIYDENLRIKKVVGYRGDGSETGRRGLPVEDARLLANLVSPWSAAVLLDPFAGTGGILLEAERANPFLTLISGDNDLLIEPGLKRISHQHYTMDADKIPTGKFTVDSLATEIPFSSEATAGVLRGLRHLFSMLSPEGKVAIMCDIHQQNQISESLAELSLHPIFQLPLHRQGIDVMVSLWYRSKKETETLKDLGVVIQQMY